MQTLDLTPTWESIMPALIMALQSGTEKGKAMARDELMALAKAVDEANKGVTHD